MEQGRFWIGLAALCASAVVVPPAFAGEEEPEAPKVALDPKRSPEVQARTAIRAGDFRVARLVYSDTDNVGHISFGEATPGLACDGNLSEAAGRDLAWGKEARRFAAAYNAVLLADPRYPDRDVCLPLGAEDSEWPDFGTLRARPLHPEAGVNRAARAARADLVQAQIAAGRPFDSWDRWYRRPLHWAARRGDLRSLDLLLSAGSKTDGREPASPLLLAVDSGRTEAVERLLAAGASPFRCGRMDVRLSWGSTNSVSTRSCPIRHSIERGFAAQVTPLVRAALERGTYYERRRLIEDLLKAVSLGRTDSARAFVEGAGEARRRYLQPAVLRMAAYRLDRPMLRTLLSLGAGWAARTPAEERLWLAAAQLDRSEPLAMLIWFGGDLNYLPAAERLRLEAALPGLTAAGLRPFLLQAVQAREKTWDAILAGDLAALDSMAASGVDFAERRGDVALSRAAGRDAAMVRWVLAHGGRPDTYEDSNLSLGCSSISDDFGRNRHSKAQRDSFLALCEEMEAREATPRPGPGYSDHALVTAVRSGDSARIDLLLPGSLPEAALGAVSALVYQARPDPGRDRLLTRLSALAAGGDRSELASTLSDALEKKDMAAANAILAAFTPANADEIQFALDIGYDASDRCGLEPYRLLHRNRVDLSKWRDLDGGNLFARAATCDSAEFVAFAATVPGISVNDVDDNGRTPLEGAPWDRPESEARKALAALGGKECEELHGEDSDKCDSASGIEPDPAL